MVKQGPSMGVVRKATPIFTKTGGRREGREEGKKEGKRQAMAYEKVLKVHLSDEGFVSRVQKGR